MKKLTALLLCLVMALSLIPTAVHAANIASGDGWRLGSDGCLHITGAVTNISTYSDDDTPWSKNKDKITSVVTENITK